jgi:hypothetical protein
MRKIKKFALKNNKPTDTPTEKDAFRKVKKLLLKTSLS